jgi:hypothetical protein
MNWNLFRQAASQIPRTFNILHILIDLDVHLLQGQICYEAYQYEYRLIESETIIPVFY